MARGHMEVGPECEFDRQRAISEALQHLGESLGDGVAGVVLVPCDPLGHSRRPTGIPPVELLEAFGVSSLRGCDEVGVRRRRLPRVGQVSGGHGDYLGGSEKSADVCNKDGSRSFSVTARPLSRLCWGGRGGVHSSLHVTTSTSAQGAQAVRARGELQAASTDSALPRDGFCLNRAVAPAPPHWFPSNRERHHSEGWGARSSPLLQERISQARLVGKGGRPGRMGLQPRA